MRSNPTHQREDSGEVEGRFHNFHRHDRLSGVFLTGGDARRYNMPSSESGGEGELELGRDEPGVGTK